MKKTFFLTLLHFTFLVQSKACDCAGIHFCTYIQDPSVDVAIQAVVVNSVSYTPTNGAVYMKIIKRYKVNIALTDTVKVYGNDQSAGCSIDVLNDFPIGDTVIALFSHLDGNELVFLNPDSLTENYYEIRPVSCYTIALHVKNGVVLGKIAQDVTSYPLNHFDEALQQCYFPSIESVCIYSVFPTLSHENKVYIRQEYNIGIIERIRLYASDGRLIDEISNQTGNAEDLIAFDLPGKGMFVLEITCKGKKHYKKIISM